MWKKTLLTAFILVLLIPLPVGAAGFTCGKPIYSKEIDQQVTDYKENKANMAEKFLVSQMQNLFNIGDLNGLSTLVFGNPYCVWNGKGTKMSSDGIFTEKEREKIINPVLKMFSASYVSLLLLAMLWSSLKLGFNPLRGHAVSEFWEDVKMWVFSAIFITAYSPITNLIFELNAGVVLSFYDLLKAQGVEINKFSIMSNFKDALTVMPVVSFLIVILAEWLLALILNIVYIARKTIILVLLVMGFVAAYSLLFKRSRAFFGNWMKELIGNVFLQSIHALLLFVIAMMANMGASVLYKLGLMMMFIPLTGIISRWLNIGDTSTKLGSALTMMGMGGIVSTYTLTKQAANIVRGGNISSGITSIFNRSNNGLPYSAMSGGDPSFAGGIVNMGGGSDAAITKISTDASGSHSFSWQNTKNILSNIGGAVFGTAGVVAGPLGSLVMATIGAKAVPAIAQGARNLGMGMYHAGNTIKNAMSYVDGNGNKGIRAVMGNLAERRTFMGNLGESLGSIVGLGLQGRQLGHALSGVSRQRLMATSPQQGGLALTDQNGNIIPPSFKAIQQKYPGADLKFIQTNKESSLWLKNPITNSWQQIGLTGQADPTLRQGAARVIDYKVPRQSSGFELQPNGSYKSSSSTITANGVSQTTKIEGLPGSNPHLMRTSNAYIVGTGSKSGRIDRNMVSVVSNSAVRYEDSSFDSSKINPDSYIAHHVQGSDMRSTTDRLADKIHHTVQRTRKIPSTAKSWVEHQNIKQANRNRRIL